MTNHCTAKHHRNGATTGQVAVPPQMHLQRPERRSRDLAGVDPDASMFRAAIPAHLSLSEAAHCAPATRRHDRLVEIEADTSAAMPPDADLSYSLETSPFGPMIAASTARGLRYLAFADDIEAGLAALAARFPGASSSAHAPPDHRRAASAFEEARDNDGPIRLDLLGTPFQKAVWQALVKIPMGALATYAQVAAEIDRPGAARAVGAAIGANPTAFLIPCHRVVRADGTLGGFMWGPERKRAMIGWEGTRP